MITKKNNKIAEVHTTQGTLIKAEFWNMNVQDLNDKKLLRELCEEAVRKSKCIPIQVIDNQFEPQGVSVLCFLEESHLAIHTYPEHNYCSIVIYTCGTKAIPEDAYEYLREKLNPSKVIFSRDIMGIKPYN